jgi:hypothetical protein
MGIQGAGLSCFRLIFRSGCRSRTGGRILLGLIITDRVQACQFISSLLQAAKESTLEPPHRLGFVCGNNEPPVVKMTHFVAGERVPLLSGRSVPPQRSRQVLGHAFTVLMQPAQTKLSTIQTLPRAFRCRRTAANKKNQIISTCAAAKRYCTAASTPFFSPLPKPVCSSHPTIYCPYLLPAAAL